MFLLRLLPSAWLSHRSPVESQGCDPSGPVFDCYCYFAAFEILNVILISTKDNKSTGVFAVLPMVYLSCSLELFDASKTLANSFPFLSPCIPDLGPPGSPLCAFGEPMLACCDSLFTKLSIGKCMMWQHTIYLVKLRKTSCCQGPALGQGFPPKRRLQAAAYASLHIKALLPKF